MITDRLEHAQIYETIHPMMKEAFRFLLQCQAAPPAPGRYALQGEAMYAIVSSYLPEEKAEPRYETHDRYLDIQCMLAGSEYQWYAPRSTLECTAPYNSEKDVSFYSFSGNGSRIHLTAGSFAVYFPQDGHLPSMCDAQKEPCVRVVVKIKC